jgi:hypothetical protein
VTVSASPILFGPTGAFVLNTVDVNGTKWIVTKFDGWHGTADTTLAPLQKTRKSGATAGDSYATGRTMTISGIITSQSAAQQSLDLDALNSAISRTPTLMQVSESGRIRSAMVSRYGPIVTSKINAWSSQFIAQIFAKDWRKFGQPLTQSTGLFSSSGGLTIPYTDPYSINATVTSGQFVLNNPGDEVGTVLARVDGYCPGFSISHTGTAAQQTFSSSLVLNTGEFALLDMEKQSILGNGQPTASRAAYTTARQWLTFDPGPNTFAFIAPSYSAAALLTITATPAWE